MVDSMRVEPKPQGLASKEKKKKQSVEDKTSGSLSSIGVSAIHCTRDRQNLFCGVDHGYVRHYRLQNLPEAVGDKSKWSDHLRHIKIFRAHKERIGSIEYIEGRNILVVSFLSEKAVSVWTHDGKCVGILGSNYVWKLENENTYLAQDIKDLTESVIPRCGDNARMLEDQKQFELQKKYKRQRKEQKLKKLLDFNHIKGLDDTDDEDSDEDNDDDDAAWEEKLISPKAKARQSDLSSKLKTKANLDVIREWNL